MGHRPPQASWPPQFGKRPHFFRFFFSATFPKPPTCKTILKTSDFSLFLIRSYRLFETHQYWQTWVHCLVFAKTICQIQGSVFTPNCENSIQWNKLCYLKK